MPPRGVKSSKRKRQYKHIKQSARRRGTSEKRAKEIAARTVNKERKKAGQTKGQKSKKSATSGKSTRKSSSSTKSRKKSSSGSGRKKK